MSMETPASFLVSSPDCHFPINNLPYGVFSTPTNPHKRVGIAIATYILDLSAVVRHGLFRGPLGSETCFDQVRHAAVHSKLYTQTPTQSNLNAFMARGPTVWADTRAQVIRLLSSECPTLRDNADLQQHVLVPQAEARMHLPVHVGDYTDFYLSKEHAENCTKLFRGADASLQPNWSHLPVAYHGRASSIVVSGHPIRRPWGQVQQGDSVVCAPCRVLDFELEMAAVVGVGNELGTPVSVDAALGHIFGLVLLNDWSARDIQKWEYVPLGPFNGKNFATTISPWVVPMAALEPFACGAPPQGPAPLPYLAETHRTAFDVSLQALLRPHGTVDGQVVTSTNMKHLYWTLAQMVAHHTVGGCNLGCGDLLGTGTISRMGPSGAGCLLEATWGGRDPLQVGDCSRTFLEDGDEVVLTGWCQGKGFRVGFGECTGVVLPALPALEKVL